MGMISENNIAKCSEKIEARFEKWESNAHTTMSPFARDQDLYASYEYNGKSYENVKTLYPVLVTDTESFNLFIEKYHLDFKKGDSIQVYINPEKPEKMFFKANDDMKDTLYTNQYAEDF